MPNMNKLDETISTVCVAEAEYRHHEARSAILKLMREMMPERKPLDGEYLIQPMFRPAPKDGETVSFTHINYDERRGFNQAIDLIESKLKELES